MKGKILKKVLAAALVLTLVSGGVPISPVSDMFGGVGITANAATVNRIFDVSVTPTLTNGETINSVKCKFLYNGIPPTNYEMTKNGNSYTYTTDMRELADNDNWSVMFLINGNSFSVYGTLSDTNISGTQPITNTEEVTVGSASFSVNLYQANRKITCASAEDGSVGIQGATFHNQTYSSATVFADSNITLVISPIDNNYVLDTLNIKDADNHTVPYTLSDNTATFTMPDIDVTVTPVFKGKDCKITYYKNYDDNSGPREYTASYDTDHTVIANPFNAPYNKIFAGWAKGSPDSTDIYPANTPMLVSGDTELYAL